MIKNILIATDGSGHARKAISFASDIALKYDARIYLIHVVSSCVRVRGGSYIA